MYFEVISKNLKSEFEGEATLTRAAEQPEKEVIQI